MNVRNKERDVVSLVQWSEADGRSYLGGPLTSTGFLRSTTKLSARCIKNRVNLWHNIRSISSACLIFMLMRIELTDGSIKTRSFSLRDMVSGFKRTSLEPLQPIAISTCDDDRIHTLVPDFYFWLVVPFNDLDECVSS